MSDWTSLNFVVVDVEGNGQQPPDLVELAAVPVVGGVIGEPLSWLVKPDAPIKHFATRIHGLTNKDVADCPSFEAITGNVLAALDADALVAHNAHVDLGVLSRKLPDWESPEVFDTLKLARRLVPGLDSYRLGNLVETYSLRRAQVRAGTHHTRAGRSTAGHRPRLNPDRGRCAGGRGGIAVVRQRPPALPQRPACRPPPAQSGRLRSLLDHRRSGAWCGPD
ncbi:PolC-type DNA polymerase III [Sinosporangium album]|uniref:3'-5' exonuclease n=1 Tax=Sinosporangium album TaxID=504805 RepID=UPI000AC3DB2A|nr:3'-5' exonuclease [Sinosporangium album]